MPIKDLHVFLEGECPDVEQILAGALSTPRLERLTQILRPKFEESGTGTWRRFGHGGFGQGYAVVSTAIFKVDDFDDAEEAIKTWTDSTEFAGEVKAYRWFEDRDANAEAQHWKSIEIYYDISAIPDGYESPLDFRNEAMELIEAALEEADAGEWSGAESGMGEVNFGFDVTNFAKAEAIVRKSVKGTKYDCIRDITRFDSAKDLPPETLAELGMS